MLNFIWCFFILISVICGIVTGNYKEVNEAIFESIKTTTTLIITLLGNMCFWSGIMNIVKNTSLVEKIKKVIKPLVSHIFKGLDENGEAYKNILMNMTSNILGLGNAATPCGLKAMEELQKMNKNKSSLSKNMMLLMLVNTASIQLIPTTIISIRSGLGSKNPSGIILAVWFASAITFISMLVIAKTYIKVFRKEG